MITKISSWAEQIIIALMIATIFEMILPDCKNKKYVKTVIGLYILFTILTPIIKLYNNGDISIASSEYITDTTNTISSYNNFNTETNIKSAYILSLKQDISSKLNSKGYTTGVIKVDIDESEENYGKIISLDISISKKVENKISNNNISISKIEINNSTNNETTVEVGKKTEQEVKEIKEYLSNEYGVEINNIKIE